MVNMLTPRKVIFKPIERKEPLHLVTIVGYFVPISAKHVRGRKLHLVNYQTEDCKHEILEKLAALYDLSLNEPRWHSENITQENYTVCVTTVYDKNGIEIDLTIPLYDYTELEKQLLDTL